MNLSHEKEQQILTALTSMQMESAYHRRELLICEETITLLQSQLTEPDAGANVEFPTPAYLRVSDDPVDISITDYYTEPQLRAYADARVDAARPAEVEQEPAYAKVETEILTRYRVESTGRGFWPAVVRCGTGAMDIFVGTKKQAEHVRQALQTACLDGAFMASNAAQQGALKSEQELLK